jgi:hypothetical protein
VATSDGSSLIGPCTCFIYRVCVIGTESRPLSASSIASSCLSLSFAGMWKRGATTKYATCGKGGTIYYVRMSAASSLTDRSNTNHSPLPVHRTLAVSYPFILPYRVSHLIASFNFGQTAPLSIRHRPILSLACHMLSFLPTPTASSYRTTFSGTRAVSYRIILSRRISHLNSITQFRQARLHLCQSTIVVILVTRLFHHLANPP